MGGGVSVPVPAFSLVADIMASLRAAASAKWPSNDMRFCSVSSAISSFDFADSSRALETSCEALPTCSWSNALRVASALACFSWALVVESSSDVDVAIFFLSATSRA